MAHTNTSILNPSKIFHVQPLCKAYIQFLGTKKMGTKKKNMEAGSQLCVSQPHPNKRDREVTLEVRREVRIRVRVGG